MGTLPSSRLTRILQEKAELLKRRRASAEQVLHEAEDRVRLLGEIGITLPEATEREAQLQASVRKSDWEGVELQAKAYLEYASKTAQTGFEAKRKEIAGRAERITQFGVALPPEFPATLAAVSELPATDDGSAAVEGLAKLDRLLRVVETEYGGHVRTQARALLEWAGEPSDRQAQIDQRLRQALEPVREGHLREALEQVHEILSTEIPGAVRRRTTARETGKAVLGAAQDLGVASEPLESALRADAEATPLDWATTVTGVEESSRQVADTLRDRVAQTIESLRATAESLREYDVDPAPLLAALQESLGSLPEASPPEIPKLLGTARATVEGPVVEIVASLLDAVRPRLVEARRLGRDASEVFAAMNRAREALRLKIYSEALAASQEANEKVGQLTGDLDTAREEAASLDELLNRLAAARFPTGPWAEALARARGMLDRVELAPAQQLLGETLQALGREAAGFFDERFATLERILPLAKEREFLPDGAEADLARVRRLLDEGNLADAGELLAALEVRLRTSAGPYIVRRVEEMEKGFADIPDESLVGPVRRLLADTDVSLRVKEDLPGSLEALKRAEREFTAVFAAHASSLVEMLEDERRVLEGMGGAGDEVQRQIDEVQQIFNMGDFVKASRASQEIRTRAHQQQLIRAEETVSHAKLALVELSKLGVDAVALKQGLDGANDALRSLRYAEAYRIAAQTEEGALRLKGRAQSILDGLAEAGTLWSELKQAGVSVDGHREKIRIAKAAYQALDFEGAKDTLDVLMALLRSEQANAETRRLVSESELLREDGARLSVPTEPFVDRLAKARAALEEGRSAEALQAARAIHAELVRQLIPVLTENLRALEQDLEVARSAGIDTAATVETLGEARRRLGLPVPTGVAELIETARVRLVETRGFLEHAERGFKRAAEAVNEAELVHVVVPNARERLHVVETALGRREYAKAIDLSSSLEREMIQLTYQHVSRVLAGFQGALVGARQSGSETAVAENLLMQARQALQEGRAIEALQLAGRSEAELERVELQVRIAQGTLATVERKLADAERAHVRSAVAQAKLAEAQAAFRDRLFPVVLELAIDSSDALESAREAHRRARDALDSADRQVKEAMEVGADVAHVAATLDHARTSFQTGEYTEAARRAREAAEVARWSIERLYTGAMAEVRQLLDTGRTAGLREELEAPAAAVDGAEAALKVREWKRATEMLQRARDGIAQALTTRMDARLQEVEASYRTEESPDDAETTLRATVRQRALEEANQGRYAAALAALREEEQRLLDRQKSHLGVRVKALKERLWVGEKLGLDATPVMELFSEAQLALQQGDLDLVRRKLGEGEARLTSLVQARLPERLKETQTELVFAQEGLHVSVADLQARIAAVEGLVSSGLVVEAAQTVLESAEELNRRKALHRELMNLHYLIDAALGKAAERHLDTADARKLLDESIRARATDYPLALEKARESLRNLQAQLKTTEPAAATASSAPSFWPFRRPPGGTPTA